MSLAEANSIHMSSSQSSGASNIPTSDSILTSPNYSYIFGFEKDFDYSSFWEDLQEIDVDFRSIYVFGFSLSPKYCEEMFLQIPALNGIFFEFIDYCNDEDDDDDGQWIGSILNH